ncbi:MAG TPA: hotdog fold domain-containing protein [Jatrophihabitantaceae bacterium]|nr:hotdog fold domain-containing protein [Jatrophihabitantaceae bacterium]
MTTTEQPTPWPDEVLAAASGTASPEGPRGGARFEALHTAQRRFNDLLSGAVPSEDLCERITTALAGFADELADMQVREGLRWDGWRGDLPGRGHPLLPPYTITGETDSTLHGRVRFTRFFLGGNGAAHGGAQPLVFDDMLGRCVNSFQAGVARTAYLKVNYRRITPIDVDLDVEVSVDRVEGRKRWCSGRMTDPDGNVVADCEALFLALLPGQA